MKKIKIQPRAILFDMDGVIVDSMPYHFIAWYEALRPWNIRINCFDVYLKEGEKWQYTLKDLMKRAGVTPTPRMLARIFADRERIFIKYYKRSIFAGAEEFIRCLKRRGYLLGLVTGTPSREMLRILPRRIAASFDCIVTGDQVTRGKPSPAPYLKAARALRLAGSDCLVIENAPLGIKSAKRAGMTCFALTTSLPAVYLKEADAIFNDWQAIAEAIDAYCSDRRKYRHGKYSRQNHKNIEKSIK